MSTKIVCLGAHILDILGYPVTEIPPGQGRRTLEQIKVTAAGTAAGTAVDLAKLGAEVACIGAVGDDTAGRLLLNLLDEQGISTSSMALRPGQATPCTILPVRPNGERPALHAPGAMNTLTGDDINWQLIAEAEVLHIGGPDVLGEFTAGMLPELLRFAARHEVTTTMDLLRTEVPEGMVELLRPSWRYVDYLLPNDDQIRTLTGLADEGAAARAVRDRGVGTVVVTMGGQPSLICAPEGLRRIPTFDVPVLDTTGCGDAFSAGFITGLCRGWSVPTATRLGTAAAALVAQGLGSDAGIVDLSGTLDYWSTRAGQVGAGVPADVNRSRP